MITLDGSILTRVSSSFEEISVLHRPATHRLAPVVLAACMLLAVAACDDDAATPPPGEASSAAAEPTSDPTPTPTVEPATGMRLNAMDQVVVRAPKGWEFSFAWIAVGEAASDPENGNRIDVGTRWASGDPTLAEQAREDSRWLVVNQLAAKGSIRMLDPVTVAGVRMYHYTYRSPKSAGAPRYTGEAYGAKLPMKAKVDFLFTWMDKAHTSNAEREEIRESVFATVEWKGFEP